MSTVIKVENLSKRYRLGLKESRKDTLMGQIAQTLRAPLDNLKRLRSMTRFDQEDESVFWALRDINFEVQQGEVLGIIGHNGAGKSTLLKILSRITEPSDGRILINGRIAALLEVGTGFHQDLTGRENIYMNGTILGMTRREIDRKLDEIVEFSGVEKHLDTPVKFYSSGMKVRLGFSVAAYLEPELLIVDEVLAVGDAKFQTRCLGRMKDITKNDGRTVLFVSHDMSAIQKLCNKVLLLKNNQVGFFGETFPAVKKYLDLDGRSFKKFDKGLEKVSVRQVNEIIEIVVEYNSKVVLDIPHFGFVISDSMGIPLFTSNPTIENLKLSDDMKNSQRGKIVIEVINPKLRDGIYFVSVWFGDSKENYIVDKDCISFTIAGMYSEKSYNRNYNTSQVGSIIPDCSWFFERYL